MELDVSALRKALSEFPLEMALVFGSWASGEATSLSDLDIAVKFRRKEPRSRRLRLLSEMITEVTSETGFEAVDVVDLDEVGPHIGYGAVSEGLLVLGDPEEAEELEARFLLKKLDFEPARQMWTESLVRRIREGRYGEAG